MGLLQNNPWLVQVVALTSPVVFLALAVAGSSAAEGRTVRQAVARGEVARGQPAHRDDGAMRPHPADPPTGDTPDLPVTPKTTATPTAPVVVPPLRPPVPGPLLRGFEPPLATYGPGHRGVDLGAPEGAPVMSPAPGRVRFAGRVGGAGWVTVEVAPGALASVGPLGTVDVRAGDDVGVRTRLGRLQAGHGGGLHLGVRRDGRYVDPQPYLADFDPPRLVPVAAPSTPAGTGTGAAAADHAGGSAAKRPAKRSTKGPTRRAHSSAARSAPTGGTHTTEQGTVAMARLRPVPERNGQSRVPSRIPGRSWSWGLP